MFSLTTVIALILLHYPRTTGQRHFREIVVCISIASTVEKFSQAARLLLSARAKIFVVLHKTRNECWSMEFCWGLQNSRHRFYIMILSLWAGQILGEIQSIILTVAFGCYLICSRIAAMFELCFVLNNKPDSVQKLSSCYKKKRSTHLFLLWN